MFEDLKIIVMEEASSSELVPQTSNSREETTQEVEFDLFLRLLNPL